VGFPEEAEWDHSDALCSRGETEVEKSIPAAGMIETPASIKSWARADPDQLRDLRLLGLLSHRQDRTPVCPRAGASHCSLWPERAFAI
jgi:hypothetical protein